MVHPVIYYKELMFLGNKQFGVTYCSKRHHQLE